MLRLFEKLAGYATELCNAHTNITGRVGISLSAFTLSRTDKTQGSPRVVAFCYSPKSKKLYTCVKYRKRDDATSLYLDKTAKKC